MRALIGLLILGCLFVMAASWQSRTTAALQSSRSLRYAAPANAAEGDTAGWSRLIFGRPSGAEPLPIPEQTLLAEPAWPGTGSPGPSPPEDSEAQSEDPGAEVADADPGEAGIRPISFESTVAPRYARDFEYVVRANDSLGVICQKHYAERPLIKLVEAVALYNDLKSPDSIRAGDTILLPDAAVLFPKQSPSR